MSVYRCYEVNLSENKESVGKLSYYLKRVPQNDRVILNNFIRAGVMENDGIHREEFVQFEEILNRYCYLRKLSHGDRNCYSRPDSIKFNLPEFCTEQPGEESFTCAIYENQTRYYVIYNVGLETRKAITDAGKAWIANLIRNDLNKDAEKGR